MRKDHPPADLDVVEYLKAKGYDGRGGARERTYPCFFACNEPPDSRKRKLSIDLSTGMYRCFVCGAMGGTYLLRKHFGDVATTSVEGDNSLRRREILEEASARAHQMLLNNDALLLHLLSERGLTEETIAERRFGYVGGRWSLVADIAASRDELLSSGLVRTDGENAGKDFFYGHLMIPYLSMGTVTQLRGKCLTGSMAGRYMTGPGEHVHLYNADSLHGADEVLITEGEFDTAAVTQHLQRSGDERAMRLAVVGLPGVHAVPDEFDRLMESKRRIYIGFDGDLAGRQGAAALRERIGPRAKIVEGMPEGCDWSEYLLPVGPHDDDDFHKRHPQAGHGWTDVMTLLSSSSGRRIYAVSDAGRAFREQRTLRGGVKLGFEGLDSVISPGVLPGQVFIALARTGVGKTIWLVNVLHANRHLPALFVSMEQTKEEIYDRLARVYRFYHPRATDGEVEQAYSHLWICEENKIPGGDLRPLAAEYELEMGVPPQVVAVDYLGYYSRGMEGSGPYEKVSNGVMELKSQAKEISVHMFGPHQVKRQGGDGRPLDLESARDSGVVEETGDFVVSLFRPGDAVQEEATKEQDSLIRMQILKSRHGGRGRAFSLQMDLLTLAMVDAVGEHGAHAKRNSYEAWRGTSYEELRRREMVPIQQTMMGA